MRRSCSSKATQLPFNCGSEGGRSVDVHACRGSDVHYISWGDSAFSFIQTIDLAALHWLLSTSAQNWITLPPSYQFHNLDGKVPQCARGGTLSSAACALGFGGPRVAHHGQDPCREEMVGSRRGKSLRIIYAVYPHCLLSNPAALMWSAE